MALFFLYEKWYTYITKNVINILRFTFKGGQMNNLDGSEAKQLTSQVNQLIQHYRSKYTAPVAIPGIAKLKPVEQKLLGMFEWQQSIGIKEVVRQLDLPNSTVTSAVNRLITKDLLIKEVLATDRRAYMLKLTRSGKNIVAYNRYIKQQFSEKVLEGLDTAEERQKLLELLEKAVTSLDNINDDKIRRGFMNTLQKEYHGFGPWLIEIKDVDEIPQQYLTHKDKILAADYAFKVPVKEDRHRLRPGMLMYNNVICIYEDHLLILKASADSLTDHDISFDAVKYISSSRELLDSHIIIGTDVKTYDIDYNSVSNEISEYVMDLIRPRIFSAAGNVDASIQMDKSDVEPEVYKTLISMIPENDNLTLLGYQGKARIERNYRSTAEALMNGRKKYDLQDVMFLSNGKALIVIDSVHEVKTTDEPDYSFRYAMIQLESISALEIIDEPMLEKVGSLLVHAGECQLSFKVADDFDSTFIRRYLKL